MRLDGSALDPMKGMSREEADALCRDLAAAGLAVTDIEEPSPGVWRVTFYSPLTHADHLVTNAHQFRETVAAGLHDEIPPAARALLGYPVEER
jgi:hypothetical protein